MGAVGNKPQTPSEIMIPWPGKLLVWITIGEIFHLWNIFLGHVQVLKSSNEIFESFHFWNTFFDKVVAKQIVNAG
jgi:hypothetical protein